MDYDIKNYYKRYKREQQRADALDNAIGTLLAIAVPAIIAILLLETVAFFAA